MQSLGRWFLAEFVLEKTNFMKTLILGAAALAMTALPVAASAAPATGTAAKSLSVASSVRTGIATKRSSKIAADSIAPLVIGVGMLAGVTYLVIDKENDDDNSDSN
jgi:hypothetical protein